MSVAKLEVGGGDDPVRFGVVAVALRTFPSLRDGDYESEKTKVAEVMRQASMSTLEMLPLSS